jgi:putative endonuclease
VSARHPVDGDPSGDLAGVPEGGPADGPPGPPGGRSGGPSGPGGTTVRGHRVGAASPATALGAGGEDRAAAWYEDHGYEVLERNWRRREGEVDLIVRSGRTVVFCEVKTRSTDRFGTGAEAVLPAKQRRIRRLAARWLSELTPASGRARVEVRFDVVSITAGTLEVVEDAF